MNRIKTIQELRVQINTKAFQAFGKKNNLNADQVSKLLNSVEFSELENLFFDPAAVAHIYENNILQISALHEKLPTDIGSINYENSEINGSPNALVEFNVIVVNNSNSTWIPPSQGGCHCLSYHLMLNESVIEFDGIRTELAERLSPGKSISQPITIKCPAKPGTYKVELTLVAEGIAWMESIGFNSSYIDLIIIENSILDRYINNISNTSPFCFSSILQATEIS